MQIAFTLYMIVLFPGGAPVVTNVGTWQKASDCGTAADGAFVRKNTQGEQVPSISFVCVPTPLNRGCSQCEAARGPSLESELDPWELVLSG